VRQDQRTAVLSRSFGAVANEYDRLRAGPPPEALDWLLPAPTHDALEIGAGTGTLTRLLLPRVDRVSALEPDDRMRAVLSAGVADPRLHVLEGSAEGIPVSTGSMDLVIAQSAWHWVDEERAVPEVARVLRPGGTLALVWTGIDRSVEWVRIAWAGGSAQAQDAHIDVDTRQGRRHLVTVDAAGDSPFALPETALFRWSRPMTKPDLVALAATYSTVISMDEVQRRTHLASMAGYLDTLEPFAEREVVDVPMRSYCWKATTR
jgi:SAM-dependent methyltransferase